MMNSSFRELPEVSERSAGGLADALSHLLQLAMLEKSGRPTDLTHRELLRDRIKQYAQTHLRDPDLSIHRIALALNGGSIESTATATGIPSNDIVRPDEPPVNQATRDEDEPAPLQWEHQGQHSEFLHRALPVQWPSRPAKKRQSRFHDAHPPSTKHSNAGVRGGNGRLR